MYFCPKDLMSISFFIVYTRRRTHGFLFATNGSYLRPTALICDPRPFTLDPRLFTLDPRHFALDPRLFTLDFLPSTLDFLPSISLDIVLANGVFNNSESESELLSEPLSDRLLSDGGT